MEEVTVSKMQAVELAKAIVEARDAELAFLLQVQEIMKSTSNLPELEVLGAGDEDLELEQLLGVVKLKGWFPRIYASTRNGTCSEHCPRAICSVHALCHCPGTGLGFVHLEMNLTP